MKTSAEIRIYVACLAAYNDGILHGHWIDACQDADAIRDEIRAMLAVSPIAGAEEFAIHDYEGFEGVTLSEYQGIDSVAALAAFIEEHGPLGGAVLAHFGDCLDDAEAALSDHYAGEYKSIADFAQELTEETTTTPGSLAYYIDYDRMGRDLEMSDVFTVETGFEEVHVFWAH
ncbi:antirestriction protein ArdA [Pseudomonas aeruginosa]|uniref:antirestriction protein ArdA n=1 Tax=Pseudomonas aeruginosa TaxID=287 RepID=UPI003459CD5A